MQITANQSYFILSNEQGSFEYGHSRNECESKKRGIISALIAPGQVETKMLEESGCRGPNKITPDEVPKASLKLLIQFHKKCLQRMEIKD